ncbi:MAG: class I SAM-dependent methyltransferase [Lentimicrobiaceae bacterium]|jgi:SAM-dependent methyltransferase|nr:class I SAM-dependent methyltransferase [Lentimicrobiaceae bacterium]
MEDVDCPTCGIQAKKQLIYKKDDGVGFYQCLSCNIEFASPRLIESELLKLYEGDDWKDLSKYNNWTYENWKNNKENHYYLVQENIKLIKKYLDKKSSVLDVGCDIGLTVKSLEENGYYSEGIEISSIGSKIAKEKTGINVHNIQLENYHSDIKFDGLLLLDVLEHLYNPIKVLKHCASHMRKDGYIFIHVPHHGGLSARFKRFLHKRNLKKGYKHFGFPAHIYNFDKKSLKVILEKSGFKTIHFESWPRSITNGKVNFFNYIFTQIIKKLALSDYIICVAKKV